MIFLLYFILFVLELCLLLRFVVINVTFQCCVIGRNFTHKRALKKVTHELEDSGKKKLKAKLFLMTQVWVIYVY